MSYDVTKLELFVACPSDVNVERESVHAVIEDINNSYSGLGYELKFSGWETCAPDMGRAQGVINKLIKNCDIFVGIMWKRFGSSTGIVDSGTEEEYRFASELWEKEGKIRILFYFRAIDNPNLEDEQIKKVIQFKDEMKNKAFFREYSNPDDFVNKLKSDLRAVMTEKISEKNKASYIPKMVQDRVPIYIELLKSQNPKERKSAAETLGNTGDIRAVEPLIDALNDIDLEVKLEIIVSLGKINDKRAIEVLQNLLNDPNNQIKEKTIDALKKLDPSFSLEPSISSKDVKYKINSSKEQEKANIPFAIRVTSEKDTILAGGQSAWIIAQLYYNGLKLKLPNISVQFSINKPIVVTPKETSYLTDDNGQAWMLVKSQEMPDVVDIKAEASINHLIISDVTSLNIVEWGVITGTVYDQISAGIPNAAVTLWNLEKNKTTGLMEKTSVVSIPENPQLSNDGRTAHVGRYIYYRVPSGYYCITAEKYGHIYFTEVHLRKGTVTSDIVLTDIIYTPPVTNNQSETIQNKKIDIIKFIKNLFGF